MADGVRRIAKALYNRASEEEKKQAREFFKKLNSKGDGKISLGEFLKGGVEPRLSSQRVFKQLSSNADGSLSFDDVLLLFYCKTNAITLLGCGGCRELIFGPSFSCFECLFDDARFAVCCDCYGARKYRHQHPLSPIDLLSGRVLLEACNKRNTDDPNALAKREMEKLSKIAESHYRAASPKVQGVAEDFFRSMDTDHDEYVDLEEFLKFMRDNGYTQMHNNQFFRMLDTNNNGSLGFWEVMTLYYIIKSGRPFCDRCADFIPDIYFSCVDCFNDAKTSYNICYVCYASDKYKHEHRGTRALFLDNYTLLQTAGAGKNPKPPTIQKASPEHELKIDPAPSTVTGFPKTITNSISATDFMMDQFNRVASQSNSTRITARTSSTPSTSRTHYANTQGSSQAIIKAPSPMKLVSATFKVLEAAITIANLTTTLCTIL